MRALRLARRIALLTGIGLLPGCTDLAPSPDDDPAADTGVGVAPIVDMGAYERRD